MGVSVTTIETEIRAVVGALSLSWGDLATYAKAKMMEAAIAGGITSYTINGRTVAKSLDWWQSVHSYALRQAAAENSGGIDVQPIYFGKRV